LPLYFITPPTPPLMPLSAPLPFRLIIATPLFSRCHVTPFIVSFSTCHYFRHYFAFRHSFSPLFRHFAYFDYFHYFIIAIISLSLYFAIFHFITFIAILRHLRHYFH
jgi:hypothetical protein